MLCTFICLAVGGIFALGPEYRPTGHLIYLSTITVLLIAVCWWKGERPAWRWGERMTLSPKANSRKLLLFHFFGGPIVLAAAVFFYVSPPAEINDHYGYRTTTSMQNEKAWDEAQRFWSLAMIVAALATIAYQVLSCLIMGPIASLISSSFVLVMTICVCIPITEIHLKHVFDAQGQSINQPVPSRLYLTKANTWLASQFRYLDRQRAERSKPLGSLSFLSLVSQISPAAKRQ